MKQKRLNFWLGLLALTFACTTFAATVNLQYQGTNITGGTLKWYDGSWHTATETSTGVFNVPSNNATLTYKMTINGTSKQVNSVPANYIFNVRSVGVLFSKQLASGKVNITNTTEIANEGLEWKYYQGSWSPYITAAANYRVYMLPGTITIKGKANNTYQQKSFVLNAGTSDTNFVFDGVRVRSFITKENGTHLAGGSYKHYQGTWSPLYSGPQTGIGVVKSYLYVLPGNHTFKAYYNNGSQQKTVSIPQSAANDIWHLVNFPAVHIKPAIKTSDSTPLTGTWRYYQGTWSGYNSTDTSMYLLPGNYTFKAYYNGGSKQTNNVSIGFQGANNTQEVLWTTTSVDLAIEDCNGADINGGTLKYYQGSWSASLAANSSIELLPGNYTFKAYYNGGSKQLNNVAISGASDKVEYQLTQVYFNFNGLVKRYQGTWMTHTDGDYVLPGTYTLKFGNTQLNNQVIEGCEMNSSLVDVKLLSSTGAGLSGATIKYYKSGWKTMGTTDANGRVCSIEEITGNTKFRVEYGGIANEKYQNTTVNNEVIFNTELVTFDLESSTGTALVPTAMKYYASGWKTFETDGDMELLPANIKYRVEYGGVANEKYQNSSIDSNVVFTTKSVNLNIISSTGDTLTPSLRRYYASGWKTFDASGTMEILPANLKYRVEMGGIANEKYQNSNTNSDVVFNTVPVTVKVMNEANTQELTADVYRYYASGWKTFNGSELLPANIKFRVELGGIANEKYQNTNSNANVVFNTVDVDVKLMRPNGINRVNPSNRTMKYYASGWKTYTNQELLPANIKFRCEYRGLAKELYFNLSNDNKVRFHTIRRKIRAIDVNNQRNMVAGTYTFKYYGNGWNTMRVKTTTKDRRRVGAGYRMLDVSSNVKFRIETPIAVAGTKEQYSSADSVVIYFGTASSNKKGSDDTEDVEVEDEEEVVVENTARTIVDATQAIEAYPNPAVNSVIIKSDNPVQIFTLTGVVVYNGNAGTIDVSSWKDGMYIIKSGNESKRLIIKH